MRRLQRYGVVLAACWLVLGTSAGARAEQSSDSPLLHQINRIFHAKDRKLMMTPDRSAVVLTSKAGEVSFGADCRIRMHSPGTLGRMAKLSEGFNVNLGHALGHRKTRDPDAIGKLLTVIKDPRMNYRLRPDPIGFNTKERYTARTRPMDIWCSSMKITVKPDGKCSFQPRKRGPLGFNASTPKTIDPGPAARTATAKGRPVPVSRRARSGKTPICGSGLQITGLSRMKVNARARTQMTSRSSNRITSRSWVRATSGKAR